MVKERLKMVIVEYVVQYTYKLYMYRDTRRTCRN